MQKIFSELKNLDKDTFKIMNYGLLFCTCLALISAIILLTYIFIGTNFFYHLGLTLMKSSFTFAVEFVVCGIIVDFIRKHKI
jgi:hypothetical protein